VGVHAVSEHEESISSQDFRRLCSLIYEESGIHLNSDKKTMLELRIKRRVRSLHLNSYVEYCEYLFGAQGQKDEIVHLLDVVSTNKTDFFREPDHFEFLSQKALPDLMARNPDGRPLLIWSAGCSTGEEPYTLAIVLTEWAIANRGFRFSVLATDISNTVLARPRAVCLPPKFCVRCRQSCGESISCAAAILTPNSCGWFPSCGNTWRSAA